MQHPPGWEAVAVAGILGWGWAAPLEAISEHDDKDTKAESKE